MCKLSYGKPRALQPTVKDYRKSVLSFVLGLKRGERIDRDDYGHVSLLSLLQKHCTAGGWGVINGEEWMTVESDGI